MAYIRLALLLSMAKRNNTDVASILTSIRDMDIRSLDAVEQHAVWREFLNAASPRLTIKIGDKETGSTGKPNKNFGKAYGNHNFTLLTGNGHKITGNIQQYAPSSLTAEFQQKMLEEFNREVPMDVAVGGEAQDQEAEYKRLMSKDSE